MAFRERWVCVPEVAIENRVPARTQHYAESVASRLRVLALRQLGQAEPVGFFQGDAVGRSALERAEFGVTGE